MIKARSISYIDTSVERIQLRRPPKQELVNFACDWCTSYGGAWHGGAFRKPPYSGKPPTMASTGAGIRGGKTSPRHRAVAGPDCGHGTVAYCALATRAAQLARS